jgi:hypothetical protein
LVLFGSTTWLEEVEDLGDGIERVPRRPALQQLRIDRLAGLVLPVGLGQIVGSLPAPLEAFVLMCPCV